MQVDDDAYSDVCGGTDDRDDDTNDYNDVDDFGDRKDGVMIMLVTEMVVMVVIPQSRTAELCFKKGRDICSSFITISLCSAPAKLVQ